MKKQLQLGMVVEGNVTSSAVLRIPSLAEDLGPIKSTGLQVARRISNFLRAGYAVSDHQELQAAKLILLRVPDAAVGRVVEELCGSELLLEKLSFVLCESWLPTETLQPLRARGASVASLIEAPSSSEKCFVVEGDIPAVRQIRRVLERGGARTIELRAGTKPLYFAADLLVTALPVPLLQAAKQALRGGGVSGNQLSTLLEDMAREMVHSFLRGARVSWGGPLKECSEETADEYFRRLDADHAQLASLLREQLIFARRRPGKRSKGHAAS
jgi:predicted short-subunit dehydrogenase-like oxidoreductase (DUF2520 family)